MAKLISRLIGDFSNPGPKREVNGEIMRPDAKCTVASVRIKKIDDNNGNMKIDAEADGAKYGLGGYISSNETVAQVIKDAFERDEVVIVRFEKKRKKNADPLKTIEELTPDMGTAKDNITKIVSGVYNFNAKEWILTREAQTDPAEDPESVIKVINSLSYNSDNFFAEPSAAQTGNPEGMSPAVNVNREAENKENALMTMYFFIKEQETKNGYTLPGAKRREIAIFLLRIADQLQMNHFGMDNPSYSAYSHSRARYLLFKWAEEMSPITEEVANDFPTWGKATIKNATSLWNWTTEETTK